MGAAGLAALALVVWAVVASGRGPLSAAFRGPTFVRGGLLLLGGAAALGAIGAVWFRAGRFARQRRRRGPAACTEGAVIVEFALLLPIAMAIVLIMVQAMFMMSATVVVNYAAFAAARTAIVWVPRDLAADVPSGFDPEGPNAVIASGASFKAHNIRLAAVIACAPISGRLASASPGVDAVVVRDGIDRYFRQMGAVPPNWVRTMVADKLAYSWAHTQVQLDPMTSNPMVYDPNDELTAWVVHDYALLDVPLVGRLFGRWSSEDRAYTSRVTANCTMLNEGVSDEILEDRFN